MVSGPIVVVEDDPGIRALISFALEEEGLPVTTAANGRQAIECFADGRPDLVVLDIGLPDMTGHEVAAAVRQQHGREVPILVVTADGHAYEKARAVGAYDVVQKPFDLHRLLDAVEAGLNR